MKKIAWLFIGTLLLVGALLSPQSGFGAPFENLADPWLDPAWSYRRPVTVTNPAGTTLTDILVAITLDDTFPFSSADANGDDVRITAADGVTLHPFWLEIWNPGATSAVIWVKLPTLSAGGATLYLYYGNASAAASSGGAAVFSDYDGFEGQLVGVPPSGWDFNGAAAIASSPTRQGSRSVELSDPDTGTATITHTFGSQPRGMLAMWLRRSSTDAAGQDDLNLSIYGNGGLAASVGLGGDGSAFHYWDGSFHTLTNTWSANTWYLLMLAFDASPDTYQVAVYDSGLNRLAQVNGIAFGNSQAALYTVTLETSSDFIGSGYGDDYRLRPWAAAEPQAQVNAEELVRDVSIAQTDAPDPVLATRPLTYTLQITNQGVLTATSVTVTDPLPAGVTLNSVTASQGSCSGSATITCDLGDVASGQVITVLIAVRPSAGGSLTNTASVASAEGDPNPGNDSAATTTTVTPAANLDLSKTAAPDPAIAGDNLVYTLHVTNSGPNTAQGVVLTDTLPAGVSFVSAVGCTQPTSNTVRCSLGSVNVAANRSVTITVLVSAAATGTLTNQAQVTTSTADLNLNNNSTSLNTTVAASADLSLIKTDVPDPVIAGTNLNYTITATNAGPSNASGVILTDTLPAGVTFLSTSPGCSLAAGTLTCNPVALALNASTTITLSVHVNTSTTGSILNRAGVHAVTNDSDLANNTTSASTTVSARADLSLVKTDGVASVYAGNLLTYTLTYFNNGPSDAADVTISDLLPATETFYSASAGCAYTSGAVTCNVGALPSGVGDAATITVRVNSGVTGSVTNSASIASGTTEPTPGNNGDSEVTPVQTLADLSITKTAIPSPAVAAGNLLTYTISVVNDGPSNALSVVISDTLPTGVVYQSASGGCSPSGNRVTCNLSTVAAAAIRSVMIAVRVNASATGTLTNIATVTSSTSDDHVFDNTTSVSTSVLPNADLRLSKAASAATVIAGANLAYTLTITNDGPSNALGVSVVDSLPAGVAFRSASPICSSAGSSVTCAVGSLAVIASRVITVAVQVNASTAAGDLINAATVSATTGDSGPGANTDSVTTHVITRADLRLNKSASPSPSVLAGNLLTYTLTIHNDGPSNASGVVLTDTLPAGVTFQSAPAGCDWAAPYLVCSLGTLNNAAAASVKVVVRVNSGTSGTLDNSAIIGAATTDPATGNNNASVSTTVQTNADLDLAGLDSPDPVVISTVLTYTLAVTNWGPSDAAGVVLTDTLPAGVTFLSVAPGSPVCNQVGGVVTCSLGTLVDGDSAIVVIRVRPDALGNLTNQAKVKAGTSDALSANNRATLITTVAPAADLSLAQLDAPDPVIAGELLTYTLSIANNGPFTATAAVLADSLPAGTTFYASTPACSANGLAVTCPLGDLLAGAGAQVILTVRVNPSTTGLLSNSASVASSTADLIPSNNTSSAITTVNTIANLALTQTDQPDPAVAGSGVLTYTVIVSNFGPSDALNVSIADSLPNGVSLIAVTPSAGSCNVAGRTLVCSLGRLAAQGNVRLVIRTQVSASTLGEIENTATATAGTSDPNFSNNSAVESTQVLDQVNLSVTKAANPDPVVAGETITYTVSVANHGPSDARNVVMRDTLPPEITFLSASNPACSLLSGVVECNLGTMSASASQQIVIQATVLPDVLGSISNQAVISTSAEEMQPADNTAKITTTVATRADVGITITDQPTSLDPGDLLTYTIQVVNRGPSDARQVVISDTLPAVVHYASSSATQGTCSAGDVFTCTLGTLPASSEATVVVVVRTTQNGLFYNIAEVNSATFDPNLADNINTEITVVGPAADIVVSKTASASAIVVNNVLTYTLQVTNLGPNATDGVTVRDVLPTSVTLLSATASSGACSGAAELTCNLGELNSNASASVLVVVRANTAGEIHNTAEGQAALPDPEPSNNTSSVAVTVAPAADLSLAQSVAPAAVYVGEALTYTIQVSNGGPNTAQDVVLVDTLPALVEYQSASTTQGFCNGTSSLTCSLGDLPSGEQATVTLVVRLITGGVFENTATVSASTADPVLSNNRASANAATIPTVVWVQPVENTERFDVSGETIRLAVTVIDYANIDYVRISRWDPTLGEHGSFVEICVVNSPPYGCDLDTTLLNPAWNQVNAEAYDVFGNHSSYLHDSAFIWLYRIQPHFDVFLPLVMR